MRKGRYLDVLALLLALSGLMITAWVSDDVFERIPHVEDEFAYLWQAEVMAEGQISQPSPETPRAFPVPFVVDHDGQRFAKYPPGWPVVPRPQDLLLFSRDSVKVLFRATVI